MASPEELLAEREIVRKRITSLIISYQHNEISYDDYNSSKKALFKRLNEIDKMMR